ncbi:hypothetical protein [Streptomyces sp. NPDC003635]
MAYLDITLPEVPADRAAVTCVYAKYRRPFLDTVPGAVSKKLLVRDEDVQVLHGFESTADAKAHMESGRFTHDVVDGLSPLPETGREIRLYDAA